MPSHFLWSHFLSRDHAPSFLIWVNRAGVSLPCVVYPAIRRDASIRYCVPQ